MKPRKTPIRVKGVLRVLIPLLIGAFIYRCVFHELFKDKQSNLGSTAGERLADSFHLDNHQINEDLQFFTAMPHPMASQRQKEVADYITDRLNQNGIHAEKQHFEAITPHPDYKEGQPRAMTRVLQGTNIIASLQSQQSDCVILIGSHYDTKNLEGIDYVGANDSASSSVLLMHLMAHIKKNAAKYPQPCTIVAIWFDGEESTLPEWSDGEMRHPARIRDNTYGSRHFADQLQQCSATTGLADRETNNLEIKNYCYPNANTAQKIKAMLLLDMIGSPHLTLSWDSNSSKDLLILLRSAAQRYGVTLSSQAQNIEDDHLPFKKMSIPALDIIDFNNLSTWHNAGDTAGSLSRKSMENAGKITLYLLSQISDKTKDFLP